MEQDKIGNFIKELRKEKGLTQQELADCLGVTNKAVSKWELGKSMPDVALFSPLCQALGVSLTELLAGRRIDEQERGTVSEQMLAETISSRNLVGLQVMIMLNGLIGVTLALSPILFHPPQPFGAILLCFGLVECAMAVYFDFALPGKEMRRRSLAASITFAVSEFSLLAALNYPSAMQAGIPPLTFALVFSVPLAAVIVWNIFLKRRRNKKR